MWTMLHHTVCTRTRFFTKKGLGTFLFIEVYRSNRTVNEQRQGITMEVVPCLLLCIPLYCAFRVNRCVRPYMAGTHVRRKKGRFLHIGVFFRLSVWYTRFSLTNRNLQDRETYGRIDTKMFMGNYRLI